jgi:RNA polymerase sigma-70 factor (ECF subfamily)
MTVPRKETAASSCEAPDRVEDRAGAGISGSRAVDGGVEASISARAADHAGDAEASLRVLCDAGDYAAAATRTIDAYGGEILSFLRARLGRDADAWDVFAMFSEDLWRGMPAFAWRCTMRAWAYTLARHAEVRFVTAPQRRPERNLALSELPAAVAAAMATATRTAPYRRTEVKSRFRELRARLDAEDQLILVLRVDRELAWGEIALVLAGPGAGASGAHGREEARIRKRFQLIKERLRSWAEAEGLLG